MAWVDDFMAMTPEERLADITAINDKLRTLRRGVVTRKDAKEHIEASTRTYGTGWQGQLVGDMDEGTNGQESLEALAEALKDHFA